MGAHHAPHSSSHAARLAGRGAFTAAAALALAGGTASLAFASDASSLPTAQTIQGHAEDGAQALKDKASSAASSYEVDAPSKLPISDLKTDGEKAAGNAATDVKHAASNFSGAAKGGLTPAEGKKQASLVAQDLGHGIDHGKATATKWSSAASHSAPELPVSVLSFGQ